ncbi:MAG: glycerate kinase [Planctomycetota bacterium]
MESPTLCGEYGAAKTYGRQKSATASMAQMLEDGLTHLARMPLRRATQTVIQSTIFLHIIRLPLHLFAWCSWSF